MHYRKTLSYAQLKLHPNASKITLHNIILTLYAKDCKTKSKEFMFDLNSYMLPTHPHIIKHQTNTHFYQDTMIHKQIHHKNPKLNKVKLGFYLTYKLERERCRWCLGVVGVGGDCWWCWGGEGNLGLVVG